MGEKEFYSRYWEDKHIKVNPFDYCPGEWSEDNLQYHLNFFGSFLKGRILDYGCGEGFFLSKIRAFSKFLYGIDISAQVIKKAASKYPDIDFNAIDNQNTLPYPDNYFDTVCAIDVLEHVLDIEGTLEEINRILVPGGNFLIATSELTKLKILVIAFTCLDKYFYPASPHIRYFTKRNLASILKQKCFEVIKYKRNRVYFGIIPQGQLVVAQKKDNYKNKK